MYMSQTLLLALAGCWPWPSAGLDCPFGHCQITDDLMAQSAQCSCSDGSGCFNEDQLCTGWPQCEDKSDEWAASCRCPKHCLREGTDVCLVDDWVCNGFFNCADDSDEYAEDCQQCSQPGLFQCVRHGVHVCIADSHLCDGIFDCTDFTDESPDTCNNCDISSIFVGNRTLWRCQDGAYCIRDTFVCDGFPNCLDASDEFDCGDCNLPGATACPGLPSLCISQERLCDGVWHCPDGWDELLDHCGECTKGGVVACDDGSSCVVEAMLCDGNTNCADTSDEMSKYCPSCEVTQGSSQLCTCPGGKLDFKCHDDGCIKKSRVCTGKPLCEDKSDMDPEICHGQCFVEYPSWVDPFRKMCQNGEKCYSIIRRCDSNKDCEDGSDEDDCPIVSKINWWITVLLTLASLLPVLLLHGAVVIVLQRRLSSKTPSATTTIRIPRDICQKSVAELVNMNSVQNIVFNSEGSFFIQLLDIVSLQYLHPEKCFDKIMEMRTSLGIDDYVFLHYVKEKFGSCSHSLFLINQMKRPSFLKTIGFRVNLIVSKMPNIVLTIAMEAYWYSPVFFTYMDFIKDVVFLCILRNTITLVFEENGDLAVSAAEVLFWILGVCSIVLTHLISGLYCFLKRRKVFYKELNGKEADILFNFILAVLSPLLPLFYMINLAMLRKKLHKKTVDFQNKKISCQEYLFAKQDIDSRSRPIITRMANVRLLLGTFGAIPQLILLLSLMSFWKMCFFGSRGNACTLSTFIA